MNETYGLLAELLGEVNGLHWPIRRNSVGMEAAAAIWELQRDYPANGVPWASSEATEAGRRWSQRNLEWLTDEGLAVTHRGVGKRVGVALTERGLQVAEALTGEANIESGYASLQKLLAIRDKGLDKKYLPVFRGMVPETLLADAEWGGDTEPFAQAQIDAMPAIVRGWITTNSTVLGHLWYSVTPEGEAAAKSPSSGKLLPDLPEWNAEAADACHARFMEVINHRRTLTPKGKGEIAPCPLPVSYAR